MLKKNPTIGKSSKSRFAARKGGLRRGTRRLSLESLESRKVLATAAGVVSAGELAGLQMLYAVNDNQFDFNDAYTVNNSGSIAPGSFDRVAYFVELSAAGDTKWVWVSMDTFNTDPTRLGVPKANTNIVENGTLVSNLHIESNHPNVTPGTAAKGIIEFWASNYDGNGGGQYGSNNGAFDWKDSGGTTGNGHGSFQVFAFTDATLTNANVLFGITANGGAGIGNQIPAGANNSLDWTFGNGTGTYAVRNVEIWVGNANVPPTITNLDGDSQNYTPGVSGVQAIDQGAPAIANDPAPVGANGWNGGSLSVGISAGGVPADDVLGVINVGNGAGQIGYVAGTVSYEGTPIGTAVGGTGGANLVITFNGAATTAAVSALLHNISFLNGNAATLPSTRLINFTLKDGDALNSNINSASVTMNVGGAVTTYVWDGTGDGSSFSDAANWEGDSGVPDSNDIAIFRTADPGVVNLGGVVYVGEVRFDGTGSYTLQNGSLNVNKVDQQATATGNNIISAQISSIVFTGLVASGQLHVSNSANSLSLLSGMWTVTGGTLAAPADGANSGLGLADVTLAGGTLDLKPGVATFINGLNETIFNGVPANAQDNIEGYRNAVLGPADARGVLTSQLHYNSDADVSNRAAALGAVGFDNGDFSMLWTTTFTPNESGVWGFRFNHVDDNASMWIDTDGNGTFELANRFYNRGCCAGSADQFTPILTAGTPYLVGFVMSDTGGGGDLRDFEVKSPTAAGATGGAWVDLTPTALPGLFQVVAIPSGGLSNNITVTANSEINLSSGLPGVTLGRLTMTSGTTLFVDSNSGGQSLSFAQTSLGGNDTINSTGKPNITLSNISETAPASLAFSGDAVFSLPTANTYTGLTTINSGATVNISANNALGTAAAGTIVQAGGSLRLSGGFAYTATEPLTISGNGNSVADAAFYNRSGNNDFYGAITLAGNAKIRSATNTLRLYGQINAGANNIELRSDNPIEVWTGLSGSGTVTKTGGDRVVMLGVADAGTNFSGQLNINEGIWDARGNNSLGTTAGATIVANNARLELRDGKTLGDNITIAGNSGGNGAIRNENNSNTLTGTITLTGASSIHVNDTQLTITGQVVGGQALTKTGAGTLILKQDSTISNFDLAGGEVRISTQGGLGNTSTISVEGAEALEFDGSLNFNAGSALQSIVVNGGTLTAVSGTTTLDIPINVGFLSDLIFNGSGNLIVQRAFGNGNTPINSNALNHYGYRRDTGDANFDLNNNGGMLNGLSPTTHPSYTGQALLTGPLSFPNEASITAANVFNFNIAGYNDNYVNMWVGYLNTTEIGNWQFQRTRQDDWTGMWIDIDQDGILESTTAGLGSNRGEQLAYNDGGVKTVNLTNPLGTGRYLVAFTQLEGGGEAQAEFQFKSPSGASLAIINPSAAAQAGLWSPLGPTLPSTSVIKNGTGTVTFAGNNTYNGSTTINAGMLVAANPTNGGLGVGTNGITIKDGATLGLANGATVTGQPITVNGGGAAGQPGAIVNVSGNNSYTGAITAQVSSAGNVGIGATSGTLTLNGTIDQQFSKVTFAGAGNVVVNSNLGGVGVDAITTGFSETLWELQNFPTQNSTQNDIESIINTTNPPDAKGILTGHLSYPNNAAFRTRALALGSTTWNTNDGDGWTGLWTALFTPTENGVWQFQVGTIDNETSFWIDTTGNANIFELTDRFGVGTCCGGFTYSTPTLVAGQTYRLGITARDFEGGNFNNLQIKSPSGGFVALNPSTLPAGMITTGTVSNNAVVMNGTGTVTLAGNNTYNGTTTINTGTLIAANSNALGATTAGTTVANGATLGLQGGITINGEAITVNGTGAAGQPGALANISGNNTIGSSSSIVAQVVSLGQIGIGSTAGTLTVNSNVDLKSSKLIVNGTSATVVNGTVSGTGVDLGGNPPENIGAATGVFANVPEASNYILTYELTAVNNVNGANPFPYTRDNTTTVKPFDRIAYYLELQSGAGALQYVYVSMDAFTGNLNQIGIPNGASLFKWQQIVANMNVYSNFPGIVTGTGITTGNIEIWPSNYGGQNDLGIPNANGGTYDFGDGGSNTGLGYGSFQIHNYGASQVILAYNNWRSGSGDLGIGSQPAGNPDYTFANNLPGYTVKRMAILVHETTSRLIQADNSLLKTGAGTLVLNGANSYNGTTTINAGTVQLGNGSALGSTAAGTTVASGAVLDLNGQAVGAETVTLNGTGIGGGGALINSNAAAASLTGNVPGNTYSVGGTGDIALTGVVQGALTKVSTNVLTLGGTSDNGGLTATVNTGKLILAKASSAGVHAIGGAGTSLVINNGATVQLGGTGGDQIYTQADVQINAGGIFDLNGRSEGFDGLSGTIDTVANAMFAMGRDQGNTSTLLNVTSSPFSTANLGSSTLGRFAGLDFQPGTNTLFASSGAQGANPNSLFTISPSTGAATLVGAVGTTAGIADLAIDNDGTIYGHDFASLYKINPTTGAGTIVGTIPLIEGLAVDPTTNILYGLDPFNGDLYSINKVTAASTLLGSFGAPAAGQFNGFGINSIGQFFGSVGGGIGDVYVLNPANFSKSLVGDAFNGSVSDIAFARPANIRNTSATLGTLTVGEANTGGVYAGTIGFTGADAIAITKTGSAPLYLDGANTYVGQTLINNGYLVARNNQALGSSAGGTVVTNPGTLQLESLNGVNVNIANEPLTISGFGVGGTRGALASWSGTNSFSGPITIAGDTSMFINSGSLDLSGVISGAAGLTNRKIGAGTLTYSGSGSNTFAGTTILDLGILTLAKSGGAVAIAGPIQMGGGNANQPFLRMGQSNQFGPGVVMTQANSQGNWVRFDLLGTSQTLAGIQDSVGGLVIQNGGIGVGSATDATLTINNTADYSIGSHVRDFDNVNSGGKLNIVKNGTGTFTMSQLPSNQSRVTYTGTTTVNAGTLVLTGLGEANNTYRSNTTVNAGGTLRTAGAMTLQTVTPTSLTLNGGIYEHTASQWIVWTGLLTVNANSTINVINNGASNQVFFDGGITGANRTLTINNTGSATTGVHFRNNNSGINSYSGALIVNNGEIAIGNSAATWFANTDVMLNGAQLQLGAAAFAMAASGASLKSLNGNGLVTSAGSATALTLGTNNGSGTYSGTIINGAGGTLSLIKTGTGTQVLTSANSFTGTTQITGGGVLEVSDLGAIGQGTGGNWFAVQGGATFRYTGSGMQTTTPRDIYWNSGAATFDITSPTGVAVFDTTGGATRNQTMTKLGAGRMTLASSVAGVLPTSGAINLSAGSLEFQPNTAGTTLSLTGPVTGIAGTNIFVTSTGIVRNDNLTANWSANLASLTVAAGATFDLRGNNVTVAALQGAGSIINSYYRANNGLQGETLTVGAANGSGAFGGVISGSSTVDTSANGRISLTKIGSGTQLLNGASTFTGPTLVTAGTLGGDGSVGGALTVNSGATLSPGTTIGDFASGDVTLASGSIFAAQLNGTAPGTGYDQLVVNGTVTINGATLSAMLNFASDPGQVIVLIANDGNDATVGSFVDLPEGTEIVLGGQRFFITYNDPGNRFGTGNDVALVRNNGVEAIDDAFGPILMNATYTNTVKDNDIDPDNDGLVSIFSQPNHGTVEILDPVTGEFLYTPDPDYRGADSFVYQLSDGEFSDTATVTLTIDRFVVQDGTLYVAGTNASDRIIVEGGVNIRYNGGLFGPFSVSDRVVVYGNYGDDTITVSASNGMPVEFYGGEGNDYLAGGDYADTLDGGEGSDRLLGGNGSDVIYGGGGNDTASGGNGADRIYGDAYLDADGLPQMSENPGKDNLNGDAGHDFIDGQGGNDTLYGSAGNDFLRGGDDNDTIDGGDGNDTLVGDAGGDTLYGRAGLDVLIGGIGFDTLLGGDSADLIYADNLFDDSDAAIQDIAALWFTNQKQAAMDMLISNADDDGQADNINGEADADWYAIFNLDSFLNNNEKKSPNMLFKL